MELYHGSNVYFKDFDLKYAKPGKDFGLGIYLTTSYEQAEKWAYHKTGHGYVYAYEVDDNIIDGNGILKIRKLTDYTKEWLDFICQCRIMLYESDDDIIYDRMADNRYPELTQLLIKYLAKQLPSKKVIGIIMWKTHENDQYCFKTMQALEILKRTGESEVWK